MSQVWRHRLAVRIPPSHGGDRGSIPLGAKLCLKIKDVTKKLCSQYQKIKKIDY